MFRKGPAIRAVDGVSFTIGRGETLALVGESGCGKSTVGRTILRLMEPTAGEAIFEGREVFRLEREELRTTRRRMQIVFQDPYSSLNPRMTVGDSIAEGIEIHRLAPQARDPGPGGRPARRGRSRPRIRVAVPARVLRRPAAADRHRPGPRGRAGVPGLRRTGLGARRLGPGPGPQPADGSAEPAAGSPTCSSRTTSPWCDRSPTGSP